MNLREAIRILEAHNEWRRDNNVPPKTKMQNPKELGIAIDLILKEVKLIKKQMK